MVHLRKGLVLAMLLATTAPAFAQSRVLVFNTDASDPAPKAAFDQLIADFEAEYPEIDVASAKIGLLERHGYSPEAYFVLPVHCWLENYYRPIQSRFDAFLERHGHSDQAKAIVDAERHEIALYERFRDYYSYGVYVAKKV